MSLEPWHFNYVRHIWWIILSLASCSDQHFACIITNWSSLSSSSFSFFLFFFFFIFFFCFCAMDCTVWLWRRLMNLTQNIISSVNWRFQAFKKFRWVPSQCGAGIAQSVYRLATGWKVRVRIPVGARFSAPVQSGPGVRPASYTMGTGSFPGVKQPRCGVDHASPSSVDVKERLELYLYSPLGLRGLFYGELYL